MSFSNEINRHLLSAVTLVQMLVQIFNKNYTKLVAYWREWVILYVCKEWQKYGKKSLAIIITQQHFLVSYCFYLEYVLIGVTNGKYRANPKPNI